MKQHLILTLWIVCSAIAAHSQSPQKQIRYIMGAACEIEVYSDHDESVAMDAAFAELHRIDSLLSNWNNNSDLMRLNRAAGAAGEARPWVAVAPELLERIQMALRMAEATEGRFDPTVGPLVRAYGFLPSQPGENRREIAEARSRVGWSKIKLDTSRAAVQFEMPGMEIDLGGSAKGYAAARAAQRLRRQGITSALVSLGGSSIVAIGTPPGELFWPLLIRDPRDGTTAAATIGLHDGEGLATSGTYENVRGRGRSRRSHIIDPRNGQAVRGLTGVTVLSPDAEIADALTKAFFFEPCCSAADWAKWLARFENASIILLQAQRGELKRITGGAHPERFGAAPDVNHGHAAKADRRSTQHLPRDGEGGPGHPALASQAGGAEAHRAAGYHTANVFGDAGALVD
jgi:FAD:protein FMN transferase